MTRLPSLPVLCLVILALAGCGSPAATSRVSASVGANSLPTIKPPAYLPGPLNGESTPRARALRRPLAVVIENFAPDSRPQTGLAPASTVIETLAEGGVTRFMALYLEGDAPKVGPVRSTRMYFDHWAGAYHAILAHVGGNDDAQAWLWTANRSVFNIDENRWEVNLYNTGTPLFWRSSDRVAPHNMYVSTIKLRRYAVRNHQDWAYTRAFFLHKKPAPLSGRGRSGTISIAFINPLYPQPDSDYAVQYRYDRASNTYLRFMGGAPHVDAGSHRQLRPSNVIVMRTGAAQPDPNAGITPQSILIPTIGTGTAWFFRDGKVQQGRWQQRDQFAPLQFFDRRGRQVALDPGQTWIEVVPADSSATWSFR